MEPSVLIIMSQQADALLYGDVLQREGFGTKRVASLDHARKIFDEGTVHVMLMTVEDSAEDPFAFVRWSKSREPGCRTIGLAAGPQLIGEALRSGFDLCLELPVRCPDLVNAVRSLLAPSLNFSQADPEPISLAS